MFPEDDQGLAVDDQFYVGSSGILVKPIVGQGVEEAEVYLADAQVGYLPLSAIVSS